MIQNLSVDKKKELIKNISVSYDWGKTAPQSNGINQKKQFYEDKRIMSK